MSTKPYRITIDAKEKNSEAKVLEKKLLTLGFSTQLDISKVYTVDYDFSEEYIDQIIHTLYNPVVEKPRVNQPYKKPFTWALELGFLPGVTDNVANSTSEIINDLFKLNIGRNKVFTSKLIFFQSEELTLDDVDFIAHELINTLIERFHIKSYDEYQRDNGMDIVVPKVKITEQLKAIDVDLNIPDSNLINLGKKGVLDPDTQTRRGPLALDLPYLKAIQSYFENEGRNPTDIEIESIAQTWSEHCKHTIFAAEIDDIKEGIFTKYIRGATDKIRKELGENDFCLSVFKDNSGGIIFDEDYLISDKAETHNSPSALDPFGGAITGIVGVNRDTLGFGMGALPIANKYGFCLGRPEDDEIIYREKNQTNPSLSPRRIMDGVVHGVNVGGNCSGIPTPTGFVFFDDHYKGKPLVFVGTIGLMPRTLPNGNLSYEKCAEPGDHIVMIGGKVGKDGIHGATFSSEEMDEGSPATAVQIGDPITQKKFSDAIAKEARDMDLYNSITDNGAGGLSCSVAEMAEECGGFVVDLEKVPLKYPGLQPWEIWISESQERMTLSVPDNKLNDFMKLMDDRGIDAAVIGTFNNTSRAVVNFHGETIFDLDMDFLHDGLPKSKLVTRPYPYQTFEPNITISDHEDILRKMLGAHNNCSFEFISKQYDHEVQGTSVIKPLQGKGRVNGTASVIKPLFYSRKGVVMSQSLYPRLSEISCYDMAAAAIDTAIRNCVAVGGNVNHMALMDNFCWCSSNDPERLYQLKEAAKGCHEYAVAFKTPLISGKDSMFNDFKGFDEKNNPVKISVHPTLMISAIGVIDDVKNTSTMDFKLEGDLIYIIGVTKDECGGSEFYHLFDEIGSKAPKVDPVKARKLYETVHELHQKNLLSACHSVSWGGFLTNAGKMAVAGRMGAEIDVNKIPTDCDLTLEKLLYSETQSRFIVTVSPAKKDAFENKLRGFDFAEIGKTTQEDFIVKNRDDVILQMKVREIENVYKERFKEF